MFILYSVAVGVLLGLLLGGRPSGLANLTIRWTPLIVGGLVAQVVLFSDAVASRVGDLGPILYLASTLAVVAAMIRNWSIPGLPVTVAGAVCNLAAVVSNGGFMPSTPEALAAAGRVVSETYTNSSLVAAPNLWFLTDIFALPRWLPLANVFSVGDVLIGVGIATAIVVTMRRARRHALAGPSDAGAPGGAPVH